MHDHARLTLGTFGLALFVACGSNAESPAPHGDGGGSEGHDGASTSGDDATAGDDTGSSPGSSSGASEDSGAGDSGAARGDAGTGPTDASAADGGGPLCKRGIAANTAPGSALAPTASAPGVTWWYNWALTGSGNDPAIEFVPMVWGSSNANSALPAGAHFVLGFNEPNFTSQSHLTPQQAAAAWPSIQVHAKAAGIPLVSPAVNYCGSASDSSGCTTSTITDPYTWLKDFFAACSGCKVDYVAVHWYNCDLPSLRAYLEGNLDAGGGLQGFTQFGKPIWLTEFSCGGSSSVAEQQAYMKAAVPYLEANPHVARYSWFSAGPIPNAELVNGDGTLTDLGETYVGLPATCR